MRLPSILGVVVTIMGFPQGMFLMFRLDYTMAAKFPYCLNLFA
ncbi:conserved hypothetical protein [Vibrio cholerae O1 str. 2010EL-1786]|uniref:Uncharacterized protein n=3 Tax=Vibrio cholerae TaxID=666 RepID=Q9KL00_VIBCH|nr:hypothetical protein VC_A0950 [Vibrio cholerae O1 biovar El Tor str. N16961]ACP07869.1 conserved hypothetical protein [Vibrio cholerae M66-2]ACP11806.1 conserved hypothetical protein [Vibrio cholerae O395]AET29056.1 conserved hypothetical protein [Vibrio cholerae O1 str. 2010EL-1786]EET24236.1 conserved hypothetical protein [Vibrio cholerae MO10]